MTPEQAKILIEVANDVKWIKQEAIDRNGTFKEHIHESNKFRHQVTRNTTWRIAHHFFFTFIISMIGFIAWRVLK